MRYQQQQIEIGPADDVAPLDLVVPFTDPQLTRRALRAASHLGQGLHAAIRLIKIQTVPYPLDPCQSPVDVPFLEKQLRSFHAGLPVTTQIRLTRDFERELEAALNPASVVVLASKKRPWKTQIERLASHLTRHGHQVVLVGNEAQYA